MDWFLDVLTALSERLGEGGLGALMGLATGVVFGVSAQRSSFCLRAATVEFGRGIWGGRLAVWLLVISTAMIWVQGAQLAGWFDASDARMMAVPGSWSGAIIGGLMFGAGMVLARGCSGRLLVLGATGNLRSVVSGLVFAVTAQMALHGALAPLRNWLAALWVTPGGRNVNLATMVGLPDAAALVPALGFAVLAWVLARRNRIGARALVFASGVGFAVALGWVLTWALAQVAWEPVVVTSATFTGPSANALMYLLESGQALRFDVGLVPGVALGAFVSAWLGGQFAFQGFDGARAMQRSMLGAVLMGFGGMLAGGCAIGAGVTGGSALVATAWLALSAMWAGAIVTDRVLDAPRKGAMAPVAA